MDASGIREFFSMTDAAKYYGLSVTTLKKRFNVERIYEEGYWSNVDVDYLKSIAVNRYGHKKCLIK